ncbi:MAG: DNA N-6-adenine-methyltransferase [Terasakiella sp.]|uniref:DNA N-6-adenine-methyltransferase n=1 Tax=unclassified Terasakiella TaxID=2614952 RepID=UPI003AFFB44D
METQLQNLKMNYLSVAGRVGLSRQTVAKIVQSNGRVGTIKNLLPIIEVLDMRLKLGREAVKAEEVGLKLKQSRLNIGITQSQLADKINVSLPTIRNLEQSKGQCDHLFNAYTAMDIKLNIVPRRKLKPVEQKASADDEWYSPHWLLDKVYDLIGIPDLDPCSNSADPELANVKAKQYYIKEDNGLEQRWAGNVYLNPPFSRLKDWVPKTYNESLLDRGVKIMLIPLRPHTQYWHQYIDQKADIFILKERLTFIRHGKEYKSSSRFPYCLVLFNGTPELVAGICEMFNVYHHCK